MSKLNAGAKEWTPSFAIPSTTAAPSPSLPSAASQSLPVSVPQPLPSPSLPQPSSAVNNTSATTGLRAAAQDFVPSFAQTSQITTPPMTYIAPIAQIYPVYYPPAYYPQPYDPNAPAYFPLSLPYDMTLQSHPQPLLSFEGQKSRSNSLSQQELSHTTTGATANNASTSTTLRTLTPTLTSVTSTPSKVTEFVPKTPSSPQESEPIVENSSKIPEILPISLSQTSPVPSPPVEVILSSPVEVEVPEEEEQAVGGWQRGKALQQVAEVAIVENLPTESVGTPWKRGTSMVEKTPAQMLLREDGIQRFSRETLVSIHQFGSLPPPELVVLYGQRALVEREECKSLGGGGGGGGGSSSKSPSKPRRDVGNKRRDDLFDEPHPDERVIFKQREDVFRYDPNRVIDESATDNVIHKAIALLNKLSPETFEKLSEQFMNIGMETESMMCRVVDLIVSKAQMEEPFCFMYADLCKKITDKWLILSPDDGGDDETEQTVPMDGSSGEKDLGKVFRSRLLTRCQEEFIQDRETATQSIQSLEISEDDKQEKLFILRKRYTGHMRFVGEIYMKGLVKPNKMYLCVSELLESRDEEKLSCLCKLLQTIGKKLEAYDIKKKKGKMKEYFQKISELSNEKTLSTKIRFGFKDLMEMRNNNWTARREEEKAKKLSEIRATSDGSQSHVSSSHNQVPLVKQTTSSRPQDARQYSQPSPVPSQPSPSPPPEEWNVVVSGKKSKSGTKQPSSARIPQTKAPSNAVTVGNKFSVLTSSAPNSTTSQRSGRGRSRREEDEEEGPKSKGKNLPQVSIPTSSLSLSTFSPQETESPVGSEMSPVLRKSSSLGEDGVVSEETLSSAVAIMNEYFLNDLVTEAIEVMKDLVHPNSMGQVIRAMIRAVMEKKPTERAKFNILLQSFYTAGDGLVSRDQCVAGISLFLNDFDDIVYDVPLVGDYVAGIIGSLFNVGAIENLAFIFHLPEENYFSESMNQYSLVVKTCAFIRETNADPEVSKQFFKDSIEKDVSELDSLAKEQVDKAIEKANASYLL